MKRDIVFPWENRDGDEYDKLINEHIRLYMDENHDGWTTCQCDKAKKLRGICHVKEPVT